MWMLTGHKDDQSRQRSSFMCRGLFYLFIRAKALSTSATLPPARAWWLWGHLLSRHFFSNGLMIHRLAVGDREEFGRKQGRTLHVHCSILPEQVTW